MANEYLRRTPTSTGNNRVFTWSGWVKRNIFAANYAASQNLFRASGGSGGDCGWRFDLATPADSLRLFLNGAASGNVQADGKNRDASAWMHIMVSFNSTLDQDSERIRIYVNGVRVPDNNTGYPTINYQTSFNERVVQAIGAWDNSGSPTEFFGGELTDVFFIDGQALTPDVFGFYKQGKGYISVGSTQATDFRPGQWVPKTPRVIKTEIIRRGGFGVNGFYLPMNDSKNFGADFHCDPNSIITLNEKLPQPRVGVATTASVGLGYTDALRADPYAANLVLALPFVSSGLCTNGTNVGVNTGFGDYSHIIRGSGSTKVFTNTGVSIANTASYYGSGSYFDSGNYLSTPNVSDFQFGTGDFTMESWVYPFSGSWGIIVAQGTTGDAGRTFFGVNNTGSVSTQIGAQIIVSSAGIATSGQWNHCALVRKNGVGTIYLNGVAVGINTVYTNSIQNTTLYVGSDQGWTNTSSKMYLQDLRIYKGVAKYTGGFDVPRPYTPVGIATWRAVPDTTANNFATLNRLIGAGVNAGDTVPALLSGNLYLDNANQTWAPATIGVSTGKWYAEFMCLNGVQGSNIGVCGDALHGRNNQNFFNSSGVSYVRLASTSITKAYTSTGVSGSLGYTSGDIVGVSIDVPNREFKFYKNNTLIYTDTSASSYSPLDTNYYFTPFRTNDGSSGADWSDVAANFGQNPTFSGNTTAGTFTDSNGKGLFKYQPPSGFLALCEDNLPTPAISDPGKYFKTVLYAGSGSARSIVGVGFTPDLVWIKERNGADNHRLVDSVRGPIRELYSSLTNAEAIDSGGVLSFDSDGFSLGNGNSYNESGINHVAWCWRAGAGTTSTNTNGSITSVVSVNQDAGFSIVSYTGTGAQGTLGHGLGRTPKFIVMKRRNSTNNWSVYHSSLGLSHTTYPNWLYLNLTSAEQNSASSANHPLYQRPSDSLIYLNTGTSESTNVSTSTYVAYCWAEIEGFSKFGSYVGNGNADGPMVWCGFKPALVLIKTTSGGSWVIKDSSRSPNNPNGSQLYANTSAIDDDPYGITDFLSNGFKPRVISQSVNASGETYIFAAWAESPFQTANSK